jgi:hypothetical protein
VSRNITRPQGPRLDTPVTYLKGVGPARADALRRLGIVTAGDLLFHVPHRYEDASTVASIASLEPGMDATIIGEVISKGVLPTRKGLRVFQAVVRDDSGMIECSWPGQPFLDRTIAKGHILLLTGPVRFFHGRQLQPREFIDLGDADEGTAGGRVLSVYPATEGLSFKIIRSLVDAHLDALLPLVDDPIPASIIRGVDLPLLRDALRMVHRPTTLAEAHLGRSRARWGGRRMRHGAPSNSRANSVASNGTRSRACSPTPRNLMGTSMASCAASTTPPRAVPSSFVITSPVTGTADANSLACCTAFCPMVPSSTRSVSWGAPGNRLEITRTTLRSSSMRPALV